MKDASLRLPRGGVVPPQAESPQQSAGPSGAPDEAPSSADTRQIGQLVAAVGNLLEGIVIAAPDWVCSFANPAARGLAGTDPLGQDILPLLGLPDAERLRQVIEESTELSGAWSGRVVLRGATPERRDIDLTATAIHDPDGRIRSRVVTLRDVTREAMLEEQLRQAQRLETIGALAGSIAHDFNNSLTPILGYADLALSTPELGGPYQEHFLAIREAAERTRETVRQLLSLSRKHEIEIRTIDLAGLVRDMERFVRRLLREDIRLSIATPPTPLWVRADSAQIHQILLDLVGEALQAMPHGGDLRIEVAPAERGGDDDAPPLRSASLVRLALRDTGKPIPADALPRFFEPFQHARRGERVSGLRFSTIQSVVRQHGGSIEVGNAPDRGAVFTILLPAARPPQPAVQPAPPPPPARAPGGETILLVEDERLVRDLAVEVLRQQGYRVLSAHDAEEAIRSWGGIEHQIDLLVADVLLPGMSGTALAEELRRNHPRMAVLFFSGYDRDVVQGFGIGFDQEFLPKPISFPQLLSRARRLLDARRHSPGSSASAD